VLKLQERMEGRKISVGTCDQIELISLTYMRGENVYWLLAGIVVVYSRNRERERERE
jgi:hypothetical protein